jgi:hypothetical protein
MKTKHVSECSCGTHLIQIQYDEEDKLFYIAIYTNGQQTIRSLIFGRIRYAFYHLFTGRIYDDQIVLESEEAKKLAKFLNDRIDEKD